MSTPISEQLVMELLKKETKPKQKADAKHPQSVMPGTMQVGPVHLKEKEGRCTSKGCGASTYMTLDGIRLCTVHIIDSLNERFLDKEVIDLCECKSGMYSRHRVHSSDCPVIDYLKSKEKDDS